MTRIAHISDLHLGIEIPEAAEALVTDLQQLEPDATIVSGDLTQRARRREFRAAREYLDRLPGPLLVVPGNHDVPLFDLVARFFTPLLRYKALITDVIDPTLKLDGVTVVGLNTARGGIFAQGHISARQADRAQAHFAAAPKKDVKVLVTHHPVKPLPPASKHKPVVGHVRMMRQGAEAGLHVVLSGHVHESFTAAADAEASVLSVIAGTAISRRGAVNAYNMLEFKKNRLELEVRERGSDGAFAAASLRRFNLS